MKQQNNAPLIKELHRLMAEELEAFLRYFQLCYRLRDHDPSASQFFDVALKETLEHADAIALHLRALGYTPNLHINLNTDGAPVTFQEALTEALVFEQQALDAYKELLPRVKGDSSLEKFIRDQVATEGEHVQEIATLLKQKF